MIESSVSVGQGVSSSWGWTLLSLFYSPGNLYTYGHCILTIVAVFIYFIDEEDTFQGGQVTCLI